jgi:hypothetical protein
MPPVEARAAGYLHTVEDFLPLAVVLLLHDEASGVYSPRMGNLFRKTP